ncbi:hypothetical protein YC2023_063395 [Brassica napus]
MAKITIRDDGFFRPVMKCDGEKSKRWTTNHELLDTSKLNMLFPSKTKYHSNNDSYSHAMNINYRKS